MRVPEPAPPRWKHDCEACRYIGQIREYDLYVCPQNGMPTIIARYEDDDPAYTSGRKVLIASELELSFASWAAGPPDLDAIFR